MSVIGGGVALVKGMAMTFRHLFRPTTTLSYPEQRKEMPVRTRGRHVLRRYENGLERCIGCELCAAACPAQCINVVAEENTDADRHSPGERYARIYEINMLRCIFCGYCEEACPVEAIVLTTDVGWSASNRKSMIYTKDMLLEPVPGTFPGPLEKGRL
ncbi:MAG: NADH-quinone oxidoreductase subunit NuoI [Candidatus Dormibacteria bacterium]